MTYFVRRNDTFWPQSDAGMNVKTQLPAGNYVVRMDEYKRLYLADSLPFNIPARVYGDLAGYRERIIHSFFDRPTTTGVLLAGEKGSGKTLLAKSVAAELAAKHDVPAILVNQPFCGDDFNMFIQTIEQPAVVMFDEFEKVYKREEQEALLTLLDGVITTKKLFVLTCNDPYRVDHYMKNRPGRIYYFIPFKGLAKEFIREYCTDNLKELTHVERICTISDLFSEFNFDMLKALVEEMNRYDGTPEKALEMLNVKPESCMGGEYAIRVVYNKKEFSGAQLDEPIHRGNPFGRGESIPAEFKDPETDKYVCFYFTDADFVRYDPAMETFIFQQNDIAMTLTKIARRNVNYLAF